MKNFVFILFAVAALLLLSQGFISKSVAQTEQMSYELLQEIEGIEIRQYAPTLFSTVLLEGEGYRGNANSGFRVLAGYIFGDNQSNEKIAMTSPVVMEMKDQPVMKFMVPSAYSMEDLPRPNRDDIQFEHQQSRIVAAIRFGGWANDKRIEEHIGKLRDVLDRNSIAYKEPFSFLGYNPPYEMINRRNEVIVELDDFQWDTSP